MVDTNLIQQNEGFYFLPIDPGEKIVYFDVDIDIGDTKAICLGRVALSKAGQVLMSIVTDKVKVDGFDELACKMIVKAKRGVSYDVLVEK